jgi:hypothetical protein
MFVIPREPSLSALRAGQDRESLGSAAQAAPSDDSELRNTELVRQPFDRGVGGPDSLDLVALDEVIGRVPLPA